MGFEYDPGMSDLPVDHLISVSEAIAIIDAVQLQPRVVRLPILQALGSRLAEDIVADRDYPPFDKSLMDGFAVRSADVQTNGAHLSVHETVLAGQSASTALQPGQAIGIMTGAPLPAGADAVIAIERTTRVAGGIIANQTVRPGQSVAKKGCDAKAGQVVLARGTVLSASAIGVAACVGSATVCVFDRPRVSILATGDELVPIDQVPTGSQIRNSNSAMMQALLTQLGCAVTDLGMVADDRDAISAAIQTGLGSDALFITGGMSMGDRDYVPEILKQLGVELRIRKLRIKPGKPFAFGVAPGGCNVFGLPGNPVSAYVSTVRLANRILRRIAGGSASACETQAILKGELAPNGSREQYIPAYRDGIFVTPVLGTGSADLFALVRTNCLIYRSEGAGAAKNGDHIIVIDILAIA
jgi:molybdopterin molybdotransferase